MKILLPGAGNKEGYVAAFRAQSCVKAVIVTDIHAWAPANFVADGQYLVPPFREPDCLDQLLRICEIEEIDTCLPGS